ncbi:MAG TPA: hypothetical protein VKR06_46390 [Ktedonosporobacter sp.]|nr:hypothetical protein [Ktedonosporobacter sp.]
MAKYTITRKCGHSEEMQIGGPEKDRPGKADWLATQSCVACRRNQTRLSVDAWTEERGLVELEGTEKQVSWADKIRKELIEEMDRFLDLANASPEHPDSPYIIRAYKWALIQSKAAWWLDRREQTGRTQLTKMIEQLKANDAKKEAASAK